MLVRSKNQREEVVPEERPKKEKVIADGQAEARAVRFAPPQEDEPNGSKKELTRSIPGFPRLPTGRIHFRPQIFWQELREEHVAQAYLEFKLGMGDEGEGSKNFARLRSEDGEVPVDGPYALSTAKCVPTELDDAETVSRLLRDAATWGDPLRCRKVLSSCYCTPASASAALCEAAYRGHMEVLEELLQANADINGKVHGKTALHMACEQGHEKAAELLIRHTPTRQLVYTLNMAGQSPFEVARAQDMCGMAGRLEKMADTDCGSALK